MCKQNTLILTKWAVSNSCPSYCACLYRNYLSPQCVSSIYRYWSVFIMLSYSYLTLPEKQSSSAVTWASPGCHVFLKGCLRGTLQLRVPCILFVLWFLSQSTFLTVKCSFFFVGMLSCCVIFLAFQLAVVSLGKFCINCSSVCLLFWWDFYNSSWNGAIDFAFELPSLSYVSDVFFISSPHHTISVFNFGSNVLILSCSVLLFLPSPFP